MTRPKALPRRAGSCWRFFLSVVVLLAATPACHRSPADSFARLLDQTASWAASVQFAHERRGIGLVPASYLQDLLQTGVEELTALRKKLAEADDVSEQARMEASGACDRLLTVFQAAANNPSALDVSEIRSIEKRLRAQADGLRERDAATARQAGR